MATFKLSIADPKAQRTYTKEVKDNDARPLIGMNVGETFNGDSIGIPGFEFQITGGSDYCGFPMRRGILGARKKLTILGGVGFKGAEKGIAQRKTVCGHKIHDKISQINLKVTKGDKPLNVALGIEDKPKEAKA